MKTRELVLSLLGAGAVTLAVAACGASTPDCITPHHTPENITVGGSLCTRSGKPVSTVIMIDRTTLIHGDRLLALGYRETALQTYVPTISNGATLSVQVFGRIASHAMNLYTVQIPTLAQAAPEARDDAAQTTALSRVLDIALGLAPAPNATVTQALDAVTIREGSDIGGAVSQAINDLGSDPSPIRNVLVLTDGWIIEQAQPPLDRVLAGRGEGRCRDRRGHADHPQPATDHDAAHRRAGLDLRPDRSGSADRQSARHVLGDGLLAPPSPRVRGQRAVLTRVRAAGPPGPPTSALLKRSANPPTSIAVSALLQESSPQVRVEDTP